MDIVKYRLLKDDVRIIDSTEVFRVFYLDTGDLGGYIESENNLSHYGSSRVLDKAIVCGEANVSEDAVVSGTSTVSGYASISGSAIVTEYSNVRDHATIAGNSLVYGQACIGGGATISGNAKIHGCAGLNGRVCIFDNADIGGCVTLAAFEHIGGNSFVRSQDDVFHVECRRHITLTKSSEFVDFVLFSDISKWDDYPQILDIILCGRAYLSKK